MRISILGGGGFRVPLLARALARSGLGVRELALFDPDAARMAAIARVARALAPEIAVTERSRAREAVRGSRFVIASIRVGGQRARAHDERVCLDAGVLGQETVGAAGAALAMRNVPAMVRLARIVEREAPDAVLVNYTNPVGIVSAAIRRATGVEVIGVCDTPAELAERVAKLLYLDPEKCTPGWSGVNHLGWLNALHEDNSDPEDPFPPTDRLRDLYRDPERLRRVHREGLFSLADMAGAVPSEYVFYCLFPGRATRRAQAAGTTRGAAILDFEARLFARLDPAERGEGAAYRNALEARERSYFRIETHGEAAPERDDAGGGEASGYDRIGLAVIGARSGRGDGRRRVIVVNTKNRTPSGGPAVPELPREAEVEAPAEVGPEGVFPIPQPPLPGPAAALLRRVAAVEREVLGAALSGDAARAAAAIREHPAGGARAARCFPRLWLPRVRGVPAAKAG